MEGGPGLLPGPAQGVREVSREPACAISEVCECEETLKGIERVDERRGDGADGGRAGLELSLQSIRGRVEERGVGIVQCQGAGHQGRVRLGVEVVVGLSQELCE